jgi:hypothetical protein
MATLQLKSRNKEEFGDFQTPLSLAREAVRRLGMIAGAPDCIVEPSCGRGAFALAACEYFSEAQEIIALEINTQHFSAAKSALSKFGCAQKLSLLNGDFFSTDWSQTIPSHANDLLVIGNPPWVTVSGLGALGSTNLPEKCNDGLRGIEAITGKSNFDISEWMIYRYVEWIRGRRGTVAVLCKTSVARKVLAKLWGQRDKSFDAYLFEIDAAKHFEVAVHACFLVLRFSDGEHDSICNVYSSLTEETPRQILELEGDHLTFRNNSPKRLSSLRGSDKYYAWRSGIKHDCSRVMEFRSDGASLVNGFNETINIEEEYLYPLLKSSSVANNRLDIRTFMLVPQRRTGDETHSIKLNAPKTWEYLSKHADLLDRRASSIYRAKPPFTVFGVGPYSFAPWKIAISGLYKRLNFVTVGPIKGKPVVFDDTVNFLPAHSEEEAIFLGTILGSEEAREFYSSMIHWPDKRPITIEILRRLNLSLLAEHLGLGEEYARFTRSKDNTHSEMNQTKFAFS